CRASRGTERFGYRITGAIYKKSLLICRFPARGCGLPSNGRMRPSGFRKAEEMMLRLGAALTTLFILLGSAGAGADPPGGLAPAACPAWKTAVLAVRASDPEARLLEVVQGKAASQFL